MRTGSKPGLVDEDTMILRIGLPVDCFCRSESGMNLSITDVVDFVVAVLVFSVSVLDFMPVDDWGGARLLFGALIREISSACWRSLRIKLSW